MSSPGQSGSNHLLFDAVKEALKNKTLREAMEELKAFHHRLDLSLRNLEANWIPTDATVVQKVGSEDGSGDRSAIIGEGDVEEYRLVERSWSWNTVEEWIGQVNDAIQAG